MHYWYSFCGLFVLNIYDSKDLPGVYKMVIRHSADAGGGYVESVEDWTGVCMDLDEAKDTLVQQLLHKLRSEPGCA